MAQQLTAYVITTTLLDESHYCAIHNSLPLHFRQSQLQRRGNDLTIRIDFPEIQSFRRDATTILAEYFSEKWSAGIIGSYTITKEER